MMNSSLKNLCKVQPGTIIEGKWHKNRYAILKELGFGANGIVYLAQFHNQRVALKMSDNGMSITSEVNVLKSFAKVQGSSLGPSLIDVDDWSTRNQTVSFYVMEYIEGPDLLTFIQQKGTGWTEVLILQLLSDLHTLHEKGWVFGDLKPENLIVMGPPPRIRCIDVGGTTIQGRAIKEFTEFYDRGYWGMGTRKAEPTYDLFAVAMIIINTEYPKRFNKSKGGINQLQGMIRQVKSLHKYEVVLINALNGKYQSAKEMRTDIIKNLSEPVKKVNPAPKRRVTRSSVQQTRQSTQKRKGGWLETTFIVMVISVLYMIYIYGQIG
ncbi:protein kinase [Robertmurraya massiliosenegalensis]|uniref:protein kinase domain-containing protein n=1 Tax=Robertmurraya TaxID=2837507 RepID=UPI0039A556D3